jgi:hypothetical protein
VQGGAQPCARFTVAPGTAVLMPSSTETTLPCSRSLTCIILSPIALASMRTYKPQGDGLSSYPPAYSTRDHSSTGMEMVTYMEML